MTEDRGRRGAGTVHPLRVASYNIRKAIGLDARRDPERILQVVAGLGADMVALQEADHRFKRRQAIFDPTAIQEITGLVPLAVEHDQNGLGWHGNVLLADPRLAVLGTEAITLAGLEPRGAVRADLLIDGVPLRVVAAHLGLLAGDRRQQADTLLAAAGPDRERATIVMGDFNGWGRARYSLMPLVAAMLEVPCGRSYPSRRPLARLDRIYYAGPLQLLSCGVVRSPLARIASDHLPVRAAFALGDAPPSGLEGPAPAIEPPPAGAPPRSRAGADAPSATGRNWWAA